MGLVIAESAGTGRRTLSVHRLCVQSARELTAWIVPGRDLGALAAEAWERGDSLPISINIGLDPAIYIASCLSGALAEPELDELAAAGALRDDPVRLVRPTSSAPFIDHAEWVIHGELTPRHRPEANRHGQLSSMPEFLGYQGSAHPSLPVVEVHDVTSRPDPVFQTVLGPGLEQSCLLAAAMEADVLHRLRAAGLTSAMDAHASTAGGGQLLVFIAFEIPDVAASRAAVEACRDLLRTMRMVKTIVLVDADVDLDEHADLWWAVTTRLVPARDVLVIDDAPGFGLDPSQGPDGAPGSAGPGRTSKLLLDALRPPGSAGRRFRRASLTGRREGVEPPGP